MPLQLGPCNADDVNRVLFCTGHIYYDLLDKQQKDQRKDVAIVRLEQIYPTPVNQIERVLEKYKNATDLYWVQEEPRNMGAWPYLVRKFRNNDLRVISRKESGSPATGYAKQHAMQQQYIVNKAFIVSTAQHKIKGTLLEREEASGKALVK